MLFSVVRIINNSTNSTLVPLSHSVRVFRLLSIFKILKAGIEGFEPTTNGLTVRCSTAELNPQESYNSLIPQMKYLTDLSSI